MGKKFYIFSYPSMDLTVIEPETDTADLFGREYEFGKADCFEAMRDYLLTQFRFLRVVGLLTSNHLKLQ